MPKNEILRHILHFASWRKWGILNSNPLLENAYLFFYLWLVSEKSMPDFSSVFFSVIILSFCMFSFGYLLNDAADVKHDEGFRNYNVFQGYSSVWLWLVPVIALLSNILVLGIFFHDEPGIILLWFLWLIPATGYSLPGIYLKGCGISGLVTVAAALRTLPLLLVFTAFNDGFHPGWIIILSYITLRGLSADLAHQILEYDEDKANGITTYAVKKGMDKSSSLLWKILRYERFALLCSVVWMIFDLVSDKSSGTVQLWLTIPFLAISAGLIIYSEYILKKGFQPKNPHCREYGGKDIYYLLHKSYPKVILTMFFIFICVLKDIRFLFFAALFGWYFNLFSMNKIRSSLRIKPSKS